MAMARHAMDGRSHPWEAAGYRYLQTVLRRRKGAESDLSWRAASEDGPLMIVIARPSASSLTRSLRELVRGADALLNVDGGSQVDASCDRDALGRG